VTAGATPYQDDDLARLLRIRHVELALLDLFAQGKVSGTAHTCLGQEWVPVALAPLIAGDMVFSNHRGHGHYLALHDDVAGLLAEILGREGAPCLGVGGSQHLYREGSYLSTGVQGESLPVAVGVALHEKRARSGRRAVAFVGDGTWGEGAAYEALNMAALWRLPLVVVVENNGIAQTTPTRLQLAGSIAARAAAFGVGHIGIDSDDIREVRERLAGPLEAARGGVPLVVEFSCVRVGPHSKGDDTRSADELAAVWERDWATRYRRRHPEQFERVDAAERAAVACVVETVLARPPSSWEPVG
jgi:pyruvate dehydrogenase E1 component alpha subunit